MIIEKFVKNNKYGFKSDKIKVEFSNPTIQPYNEDAYCHNEKNIMYYYYTVTAWVKEGRSWKKLFTAYPYDFPQLLTFKAILKYFLEDAKIEDYQKTKCEAGVWYSHFLDTGKLVEDMYYVSHSILDMDGYIRTDNYNISVGKPFECHSTNGISVNINNLKRSDLEVIYTCVSEFVDYSIRITNEACIARNKEDLASWKVEDGKLYKMKNDGLSIESVYVVGDDMDDATILRGDINTTDFSSYKIADFIIDEIREDAILLSSGYIRDGGEYSKITAPTEIKLNTLLSLFENMSEERVHFNEEQIKEDFKGILSEKEKKEFVEKSVDYLFEKWDSALIDRTWMCRDEHNLPNRVKNKGNHENVHASTRFIIEELKKEFIAEVEI